MEILSNQSIRMKWAISSRQWTLPSPLCILYPSLEQMECQKNPRGWRPSQRFKKGPLGLLFVCFACFASCAVFFSIV